MKNQALYSLKDRSKKLKCRLLQFLFGALRVKFLQILVICLMSVKKFTVTQTSYLPFSSKEYSPYKERYKKNAACIVLAQATSSDNVWLAVAVSLSRHRTE